MASGASLTLTSSQTYYSITKKEVKVTTTFRETINQYPSTAALTQSLSCTATLWNGASSGTCTMKAPAKKTSGSYFSFKGWNASSSATTGTAAGGTITHKVISSQTTVTNTYYGIASYVTGYVTVSDKGLPCYGNEVSVWDTSTSRDSQKWLYDADTVAIVGWNSSVNTSYCSTGMYYMKSTKYRGVSWNSCLSRSSTINNAYIGAKYVTFTSHVRNCTGCPISSWGQ